MGTPEYNQIGERLVRDWEQLSVQNIVEQFGKPDLIYLLPRNFEMATISITNLTLPLSYSWDCHHLILLIFQATIKAKELFVWNPINMNSMTLLLYDPLTELPPEYLQVTYSLWPLSSNLKPEDAQIVALSDLESRLA